MDWSGATAALQRWQANLLGISKRGDTYLRTLLIHGARSVIRHAENKAEPNNWLSKLIGRRNKNMAAVGLANKNARIVWALLAKEKTFQPDYTASCRRVIGGEKTNSSV